MPEARKRPARARIDAIISAIGKGTYDDKLSDIKQAVELRYAEKRAELQERVLEVYGPEYEIVEKPHPNPFVAKARRTGEVVPADEDAAARAAAVAAELAPAQPAPGAAPGDPFGDGTVSDEPPEPGAPGTTPAEPQAVEIISAPERGASPAFGDGSASGSPPPGAVSFADEDDGSYESRSPIIKGGPPE